ncbi:MAG: hypothetical protein IJV39_06035 [Ruminococcus sp.]|nr:hypothetical protein [Ruminococcus sp.]
MLYCTKCRTIYNDKDTVCNNCHKKLREITDKNTPVAVCHSSGVDKERIRAALESAGIPSGSVAAPKSFACEPLTGGDTTTDVMITVPYQAYSKAYDICVGIGAIQPDTEVDNSDITDDIFEKQSQFDKDAEEFQEMSPAKRTTVRILSAILLIIFFSGVIWGFDFLLNTLKGLIGF